MNKKAAEKLNFSIPPTKIDKELRGALESELIDMFGNNINRHLIVGKGSVIYLTAVIECIINKILDYSEMKNNNLETLQEQIEMNLELKELFKNFEYEDNMSYSKLTYNYSKHIKKIQAINSCDLHDYVNELIRYLVLHIAMKAKICASIVHIRTISARTIQTAVRLFIPYSLCIHAVSEATCALTLYSF
jgi:hypothetical protein